ncbi:patatin-like phospholipase family protein [Pseudoxanthomonas mexicana]|uniref:patatin-like phospholipase family protein n=1 Tax=Pseudoxanthomonas mexicana TaxID=128785 RepID=UPI001FD6A7FD|nr:patatin-like phospholipase family protein [Pseudoxanthomonas mexicana]UOV02953.1 patatin-like phospholipase family protein [Pseudoxanthomonas mexicana]
MHLFRRGLCLAALSACSQQVLAAEPSVAEGACRPEPGSHRPSIGLALGGGGARGISHVSVLRKLEQMRIPVDCIAGTSIGSLVGGLYASGKSVDELETLVTSMDWMQLFDDSLARPERSFRRKQDDRDRLATLGVGIRGGRVRLSPGILQGQRILALFERETLGVSAIDDFDALPIPYRATATDLNTGEAVVLDHGSLAMAMRASMSLPGIFQPVEMSGRVLLDGGLANQVPVDVLRSMGADIVIAVDVGTPLTKHGADANVLDVVSQITTMMTTRSAAAQLSTLGAQDILIVPELGTEVATGDFTKAQDALRIGREAANAAEAALARLTVPDAAYARYAAHRRKSPGQDVIVNFVRLDNETRYADALLLRGVSDQVGKPLDADRMEEALLRAYAQGTLASITYEVVQEDGSTGVLVRARPKTHGPNYIQVGMRAGSDFSGNHESNLRAAVLMSPISQYGAEARFSVDIGTEPGLKAEYFRPFDLANRYQLYGKLGYRNPNVNLYNDAGDKVATYNIRTWDADVRIGREFGNHAAVSVGLQRSRGRADVEVGLPALRSFDSDDGAWAVRATVDRLDSLFFPRSGYYAALAYIASEEWLGSDSAYEKVEVDVLAAKDFGPHALQLGGAYHTTLHGVLPLQERYRLGGRGRLAGFHFNELTGQNYALLTAGYSYQLARILGRSASVGMTLEYGNAWELRSRMAFDDGILNGSVYIGFDSWLGPLMFGYGLREGGEGVAFLEIGAPF